MTESASGIILRVRPLTETSVIVHWLTPELGRVATVAKGARQPKSNFRGKLDLFFEADFSFQRGRRSDLHTLREVGLRITHEKIRSDHLFLQQAAYCAALIEQTTETETPLPGIYDLMHGLLKNLTCQPPQPPTIFAFEMKLLAELGQSPDLAETKLSPGSKKILASLAAQDWPALSRLKLSLPQTRELQHFLHGFIIYHLEKIPASRAAAVALGE